MSKIFFAEGPQVKSPKLIIALPSAGLAGSIAGVYLSKMFDFKLIGLIKSPKFTPVSSIHDGYPYPAVGIFESQKLNAILVVIESAIPFSASHEVSDAIFELYESLNATEIVVLNSLVEGNGSLMYVASTQDAKKILEKKKIGVPILEGATAGIGALLMAEARVKKIPLYMLFAYTTGDTIDPKAASILLSALSKLLGIRIDTHELDKDAEKVEELKKLKPTKPEGGMYG